MNPMKTVSSSPQHSLFKRRDSFAGLRSVSRRCGFTLVEVTMAIGIFSFGFVAMIGLLPVGLNVSRQAIETTISSQIVQQLTTQALQTDFSLLEKLEEAKPYYFDDQGKELAANDGQSETSLMEKSSYKAGFAVDTNTALPSNTTSQRLATVTVFVLNTHGSTAIASKDWTSTAGVTKFTVMIPDNGL